MKSPLRNSGFALVIALGLMAFVLLLLLSITTLVQVETRNASSTKDHMLARLNAQLGAMIALGDLQKLVGPDQRVTARSDILVSPTETPHSGTAHWTGVWSSKASTNDVDDAEDDLDGHKPQWLVSGDVSDILDENNQIIAAVSGDEMVKLVGMGNSVASTEQEVIVLTEPIGGLNDQVSGKYAFWVSDEGVKARVNVPKPVQTNNITDEDLKFDEAALAQQSDASTATDEDGKHPYAESGDSLWKQANSKVGQISSYQDISLLLAGGAPAELSKSFFHDFSVHSKSVFTNVKKGGLKRDLSSALLNLPSDLKGPMFTPAAGVPAPGDPGGPKWEQLADYYGYASKPMDPKGIEVKLPTSAPGNQNNAFDEIGFTPVVTRVNLLNLMFAQYNGVIGVENSVKKLNDYSYSLGLFPLITLWNPYDVDMVIPSEGLGIEMSMPGYWIGRYLPPGDNWLGRDTSYIVEVVSKNIFPVVEGHTSYDRGAGFFIEGGTVIEAGRAMNFSPPIDSVYDKDRMENNVLIPGSTGKVVRGFYTQPFQPSVPATLDHEMYTNIDYHNGDSVTLSHDFVNIYMTSHANPRHLYTNIYLGARRDEDHRLLHMTTDGVSFANPNRNGDRIHRRKVITLEQYADNVADHQGLLPKYHQFKIAN